MATEQDILAALGLSSGQINGILNGTNRLLLLDASAHLDWDWLLPFSTLTKYVKSGYGSRAYWYFGQNTGYVMGCANDILSSATQQLGKAGYRYSTCETGFLRGFAQVNPAGFQALLNAGTPGNDYRSEGGGITSPDNLLTHGEAFIRNYLLGHYWLSQNAPGILPGQTLWIPDDFGHDPQLPVVAQAMGMIAAGFERLPGAETGGVTEPLTGISLADQLSADKIDFNWTASDGSTISGHWLKGGYGYGNTVAGVSDISTYLNSLSDISPTPYLFVPVLSDFSMPNTQLLPTVTAWNSNPQTPYENVIAVCASFEVYAQLLQFHTLQMNAPYGTPFNANPFWTGCCASHTAVKIYHQRVTRKLLEAEAFSILAQWAQPGGGSIATGTGNTYSNELLQAWENLVPSTHHDYIPGTSIPDVFHGEQMTLLRSADSQADSLLNDMMRTVADAISFSYTSPVVVFNGLGFSRNSISELTAKQLADASILVKSKNVQTTYEGGLLFAADVPSLGYQLLDLETVVLPANTVSVMPSQTGPVSSGSITMANGLVTAVLTQDNLLNWGLTSIVDMASGNQLVPAGAVMNDLVFYADGGDEYMLGCEFSDSTWELRDVSKSLSNPMAEILETGPLRTIVRTSITYTDAQFTINFIREYILLANEPMLRMRSTGAAPLLQAGGNKGTVIMTNFPLTTEPIGTLVRGTPYHWTDIMPPLYWYDQTFIPTHNFLVPVSNNEPLCGIYHSDIPGWGFATPASGSSNSQAGTLYGMLWRNGDAHYYNWTSPVPNYSLKGSDPDVHVREYALRMPSSLPGTTSGELLQEALAFSTPLRAVIPVPISTTMPDSLSVASTGEGALITAAKSGTVNPEETIFRVYQPSNSGLPVALSVSQQFGATISATGNTALEQPLSDNAQEALHLQVSGNTIYFDAPYAITTLSVSGS